MAYYVRFTLEGYSRYVDAGRPGIYRYGYGGYLVPDEFGAQLKHPDYYERVPVPDDEEAEE